MIYPFLTLDDETEIVHSKMRPDGRVKVYLEKPDAKDCFHHATCYLSGYEWEDVFGFTPAEMERYQEVLDAAYQKDSPNVRLKMSQFDFVLLLRQNPLHPNGFRSISHTERN